MHVDVHVHYEFLLLLFRSPLRSSLYSSKRVKHVTKILLFMCMSHTPKVPLRLGLVQHFRRHMKMNNYTQRRLNHPNVWVLQAKGFTLHTLLTENIAIVGYALSLTVMHTRDTTLDVWCNVFGGA